MKIFLAALILFLISEASGREGRVTGGRIVGGVEIDIENIPFQVSVRYYDSHICGGSILSSIFVLTAAHCTFFFYPKNENYFSVRAGSSRSNEGGSVHSVQKIFEHPRFDTNLLDYDATILKLSNQIQFDKYRQPIRLPFFGEPVFEGSIVNTSGWGLTMNKNESNLVLRTVELKISNKIKCHEAYIKDGGITNRMICAYAPKKDSCSGDSGGPLRDLFTKKLIGIVSFGPYNECAVENVPGVYTRIAVIRPWIRSIVNF